jgi:heme-degrading monooxygenase HmoA
MFSSQPGFVGVLFAAAPRQRAVETLWESRAAAEALAQSNSYRHTVAAIEAAGFLHGESHVELFELQGASLSEHFLQAMSRVEGRYVA